MTDIAKYIRIFNANPDDDYATKRLAAIKSISDAYGKKKVIDELVAIANDIVSSVSDPSNLGPVVKDVVEKALTKQSSAFVADEESLQMSVCALAAALQYLQGVAPGSRTTLTISDIVAIALWNGLSFVDVSSTMPKVDQLRRDVLDVAQKVVSSSGLTSRARSEVPALKEIAAPDGTTVPQLATTVSKTLAGFVTPMRTNASLDREEINVLWWVLHGWSSIAGTHFGAMNDVQRAIVSGFEMTTFLRRLPAEVHRDLVLKNLNAATMVDASQVLVQLGDLREKLLPLLEKSKLPSANPRVFPLATLILTGATGDSGYEVARSIEEWCGRAVSEGAMLHMSNFLNEAQ